MTTTDREAFAAARDAGLAKRHETRIAGINQCHYCGHKGERCTAEVADPLADVLLCIKHTADVLRYAVQVQQRITQGRAS